MKLAAAFFGSVFLVNQMLGMALGMAGVIAPERYMTWVTVPGGLILALMTVAVTLWLTIQVIRARVPRLLITLPIYHFSGVAALEALLSKRMAELSAAVPVLAGPALQNAALQDSTFVLVMLAYSTFGALFAVQLTLIAADTAAE